MKDSFNMILSFLNLLKTFCKKVFILYTQVKCYFKNNFINLYFTELKLFTISFLISFSLHIYLKIKNLLKKKKESWVLFWENEKQDILACIELELDLISTKYSNMKTFKDAWHIFLRHFLIPLFFLLGTAYIVGVIQHALIGLTYEHFGYVYNGKFPFTKF